MNMPLCASIGPVLGRCSQHRTSTSPILVNGMFTGYCHLGNCSIDFISSGAGADDADADSDYTDGNGDCPAWADQGLCGHPFMVQTCRRSCNLCGKAILWKHASI